MSMVPSEAQSSIAAKLGCDEDWDEILDEIGVLEAQRTDWKMRAESLQDTVDRVCTALGVPGGDEDQILAAIEALKGGNDRTRQTALFMLEKWCQPGTAPTDGTVDRAVQIAEHFERRLAQGPTENTA